MIKRKYKSNILQNTRKIVHNRVVQSLPSKNTPTLYIPSSITNMLAFGTYNQRFQNRTVHGLKRTIQIEKQGLRFRSQIGTVFGIDRSFSDFDRTDSVRFSTFVSQFSEFFFPFEGPQQSFSSHSKVHSRPIQMSKTSSNMSSTKYSEEPIAYQKEQRRKSNGAGG